MLSKNSRIFPKLKGNFQKKLNIPANPLTCDCQKNVQTTSLIYGSAGFVKTTAKLWNKAPMSIKLASSLDQAKERIKKFVREEIPI